jgi:hypothetical protein
MPKPQDPTKNPKPLTRAELKFVTAYRQYRYGGEGIYRAAEKAGVARNQAIRIFNKPEVQEEIDRQDEAVRMERARQEVKDEELTVEFANRELMKTVQQLGEKADCNQRLDALRLVYVVTGRIQTGNSRVLDYAPPGAGGGDEGMPERFDYRALIKLEQQAPIPLVAHVETTAAANIPAQAAPPPTPPESLKKTVPPAPLKQRGTQERGPQPPPPIRVG